MNVRLAPAWVLLALGACTAVPETTPRDVGVDLPETFTGAATDAGAPPDLWWRTFDDAALTTAVEIALTHNRDLGVSVARLDAALARADVAGSGLWPQVGASAGLERRRLNFIGLPIGGSDVLSVTTTQASLGLDLAWEIDLWGRVRAGEIAANSDVEAATADLRGARLSIAARTAKAWFACIEAAQQLRLAEQSAASYTRTEQQVARRFESGVRSALDLRLARTDRENADALVEQRTRQRDATLRQLQVLLGGYPDAAIDPGAVLPPMPGPIPAGIPADVIARRPDLVAAERRLAAADARVAEAKADLYPRVSLTASGGTSSTDLQDLLDLDFRVWSLGANLVAPLFDGGRRRAVVDVQDAQRREALATFSGAVLQALREVETALAADAVLKREVARRTSAVDEAVAAQRLSEDRYARGLVDIDTLLSAQRRTLTSETQLLAVRRLRLDNRIDLLLALGGGLDTVPAGAESP